MKKCPSCGVNNRDENNFCGVCGVSLNQNTLVEREPRKVSEIPENAPQWYLKELGSMRMCLACGLSNSSENKVCANCGVKLSQSTSVQDSREPTFNTGPAQAHAEPKPAGQSQINAGQVLVGIFVLLTIIGAVYWYSTTMSMPGMSSATFTIKIESNTYWSGAIGGLGSSTTEDGSGSTSFTIQSSIVSACVQKQTDYGYLTVTILKNGQVVASQTTNAAYGVVTVSGS